MKKVKYKNKVYNSCGELSEAVGVHPCTVSAWIKQSKVSVL